ncbi:Histone deacetylase complex subunit [Lithohypha guttulata]|uniref:Histone deacetylase complex subunit n=1 Tax=Lithohypha guttulata TaxID=1690604 RepID=A0AAN7YK24_9EURO|nr:Histone deacetylase complex subunit [Lithohypha guttulata]KAK5089956.1 Histone deacetylase complex subunit [Lithohypha guttulata]
MARGDSSAPRRSRRGAETDKDPLLKQPSADEEDQEVLEDDVTRCICGHADYPGPSVSIKDQFGPAALTEDMGNFFVQCDNCHVWQHGGCLGIHDESIIPDEYYCERCKPDFHKVMKASNLNAKSSRYLPVLEGSIRSTPLSAADQARMKELKNKALQNTKRRATMNSRGAYDEDEMLRQAIEQSKVEGTLGKRSRDESEDQRPANKRQRTGSSISEVSSKKSQSPELEKMATGKNSSKLRGAAARNNREKEIREKMKQETAAQRAEAASKRNARSERRRVDDSPPPTPTLSPSKMAEPRATKIKADTPQPGKSKGKGGARPGVRGKRVGRNQYTRDLYDPSDTPNRSNSNDRIGHNSPYGAHEGNRSRAKVHPSRTSLNEMKKRVAAILEFVSQMQTQHNKSNGSNPTSHSGSDSRSSNSAKGDSTPKTNGHATGMPASKLIEAITAGLQDPDEACKVKLIPDMDFAKLASGQMMETLMGELVGWQSHYGVYSR